jgi:hypothetical protein
MDDSDTAVPIHESQRPLTMNHQIAVERLEDWMLWAGAFREAPWLAMACHSAFAARLARLLGGPLVGRPFLVCRFAALAGNIALLMSVHRSKSAIFFRHRALPARG